MVDDIPSHFLSKWRRLLNLAAEFFEVPSALIMRSNTADLQVLVANQGDNNPYVEGGSEPTPAGFYCETVLATNQKLQIINALDDPIWKTNPDTRLGMIHYLGLPLLWPDGQKFGTLCVLDRKPRDHAAVSQQLLRHFKEQIETDFSLIEYQQGLIESNSQLEVLVNERTNKLRAEMLERERLEAALQHTRKMEALALLAGGVAHDLNNILSGIVSYPDLLLSKLDTGNPLRDALETIRDSGIRAANVVQDLLTVTRPTTRSREAVEVNTIITDYLRSPEGLSLLAENIGITVKTKLDPQLRYVNATQLGINMCVMNLTINAVDAMPAGGNLTISTQNVRTLKSEQPPLKPGNYALLIVRDTGPGIAYEEQQRIFEPYYSTKELGRSGTGLGLTTVWSIAEECGGCVFVESSPEGTVFKLYLPATDVTGPAKREPPKAPSSGTSKELILVVDDEPRQREIQSSMLEALGYRTTTASSGQQALDLVETQTYDLIILDMTMTPGMNGREAYEKILRVNPSQKAIVSSGLLESAELGRIQELGITATLKKPYTLADLSKIIRTVLGKPEGKIQITTMDA